MNRRKAIYNHRRTMTTPPITTPLVLYGIPNCDTVKRARAWLTAHGQAPVFHDFKKVGVPEMRLEVWVTAKGWERVLNNKGTTWRTLNEVERASVVDETSAIALMRRHASLLKRPVVEWNDASITIGFDQTEWAHRLGT